MNGRAMARIGHVVEARAAARRAVIAAALADAAPDASVTIEGEQVTATMRGAARRRATEPALRAIAEVGR
ncbi:hypothetical protein [Sphingomonas baiyangensis]|uniref:Uncharacterized protein n=1 Tax=Sphingomonas baiyangensis TaxID=2572576 RepID=A0A4U1L432_9SPHN|nr:hypothetical protein [Sphingomonas baiyangensis]TKD51659.1 hypothetical protein FBR43_13495 [Sphingomonas baiyangensis]